MLHSRGLLRVHDNSVILLTREQGLFSNDVLRVLTRRSGEIWLLHAPVPFGFSGVAAFEILKKNKVVKTVELKDANFATVGRWVLVPGRQAVWAASRTGVFEIHDDGSIKLLSSNSTSSIAHDPVGGSIGVVGSSIEKWESDRFTPVLFRVDHPRWPYGRFRSGDPSDLAIDRTGTWYLLFKGGLIAVLSCKGDLLGILDSEDGVPSTARSLLANPLTGDVIVGSGNEGLLVISETHTVQQVH